VNELPPLVFAVIGCKVDRAIALGRVAAFAARAVDPLPLRSARGVIAVVVFQSNAAQEELAAALRLLVMPDLHAGHHLHVLGDTGHLLEAHLIAEAHERLRLTELERPEHPRAGAAREEQE